MSLAVPPTAKQCKKLYQRLIKRAEDKGKAVELVCILLGETEWAKKVQLLIHHLQLQTIPNRDV